MFSWWIKLLPYVFVAWLAKRTCERFDVEYAVDSSMTAVNPFRGEILCWVDER
jgi:hypothetical protein